VDAAVSISMTKNTYKRLRNTVSTCRKPQAGNPETWKVRNRRQILGRLAPSEQHEPANQTNEDQIQEPERHDRGE
jgi:hypothetical protein